MKKVPGMCKEKEEYIQKLERAYERIVISDGEYETEPFAKILNEETDDNRREKIAEFIKTYKEHSLFVSFERLLSYYDKRTIMRILLADLEETETEFYIYLFAPERKVEILKEELELTYLYLRDWYEYVFASFEDDGYIIEICDNRYRDFSIKNFFRIYPDGKGFLVTDSDYRIEKTNISIPEDICKELSSEVKKKVKKEAKEKYKFVIDDREFLKSFVVTYGFEWLGYHYEWGMDNQDYFLKKYPSEIIEKVMNIPVIKEKFVNASIPPEATERFEDDI